MRDLEDGKEEKQVEPQVQIITVGKACETFMNDCRAHLSADPVRKYSLFTTQLQAFAFQHSIIDIRGLDFAKLTEYRAGWTEKAESTKLKKLERLRTFFRFCHDAGWVAQNPAKNIKPGNPPRKKIRLCARIRKDSQLAEI
jgi:site-specific recombinase XerD